MRTLFGVLVGLLFATSVSAQNVLFPANQGDMIVKGATVWGPVPGGTAGKVLMSNGPTAAPVWSDSLPLNFNLPPLATNRVWGNVSGVQGIPTQVTVNQFLDTIGYDTLRTPTNGSMIYKEPTTGTWQALVASPVVGWALTSAGTGRAPVWAPVNGYIQPGAVGTCLVSNGPSVAPSYQTCPTPGSFPVDSVFGRTGSIVATIGDYDVSLVTGAAPLASPTFTGVPAGPTAVAGTSSTQLATTAFVRANYSRIVLTADTIYYVNCSTGNNSNPGSTGSPWLTLKHSMEWLQANIDQNGFNLKLKIQASTCSVTGDYALRFGGMITGQINDASLVIEGDIVTPSNVVITSTTNDTLVFEHNAQVTLQGVKLTSTSGYSLNVTQGAWVNYAYIDFGTAGGGHIQAAKTGQVFDAGNITISGNAPVHGLVSDGAIMYETTGTTTLTGTPAFTYYILANQGGTFTQHTKTYTGAATGSRFNGVNGAILAGETLTKFPGNAAGTLDETSIYISADAADTTSLYQAWQTYTPTVVDSSGTVVPTSAVSGRFKNLKAYRLRVFTVVLGISPNAATGWFSVTIPPGNPVGSGACSATWTLTGQGVLGAQLTAGLGVVNLTKYDGTVPVGTGTIHVTCNLET